jgi:hypothetical protein
MTRTETPNMAWKATDIAQIQAPNGAVLPGFNLQQDGHSPSVTFLFENAEKADRGRELMEQLLDESAAIIHVR